MSSLYFCNPYITLYHGDALAGLAEMGYSRIAGAAVITDPKYNIGFDFGPEVDDAMPPEEYERWCISWWSELMSQGAASLVFTPGITNLPMWYHVAPPDWQMAWFKPNAKQSNRWEPILSYGHRQKDDVIVAPIEYGDDRILWHPCPKPYNWAAGLVLRTLQHREQVVIDPFAGSGTVPTVCARLGVSCIAFEVQERYCERLARFWISNEEQENAMRMRELSSDQWLEILRVDGWQ